MCQIICATRACGSCGINALSKMPAKADVLAFRAKHLKSKAPVKTTPITSQQSSFHTNVHNLLPKPLLHVPKGSTNEIQSQFEPFQTTPTFSSEKQTISTTAQPPIQHQTKQYNQHGLSPITSISNLKIEPYNQESNINKDAQLLQFLKEAIRNQDLKALASLPDNVTNILPVLTTEECQHLMQLLNKPIKTQSLTYKEINQIAQEHLLINELKEAIQHDDLYALSKLPTNPINALPHLTDQDKQVLTKLLHVNINEQTTYTLTNIQQQASYEYNKLITAYEDTQTYLTKQLNQEQLSSIKPLLINNLQKSINTANQKPFRNEQDLYETMQTVLGSLSKCILDIPSISTKPTYWGLTKYSTSYTDTPFCSPFMLTPAMPAIQLFSLYTNTQTLTQKIDNEINIYYSKLLSKQNIIEQLNTQAKKCQKLINQNTLKEHSQTHLNEINNELHSVLVQDNVLDDVQKVKHIEKLIDKNNKFIETANDQFKNEILKTIDTLLTSLKAVTSPEENSCLFKLLNSYEKNKDSFSNFFQKFNEEIIFLQLLAEHSLFDDFLDKTDSIVKRFV